MPHQGDADHFFSFCEGAWILRWAEGREATGTTRAGVEADRPVQPLEGPQRDFSAERRRRYAGDALGWYNQGALIGT